MNGLGFGQGTVRVRGEVRIRVRVRVRVRREVLTCPIRESNWVGLGSCLG